MPELTDADFPAGWVDEIPKFAFEGRDDIVGMIVIPPRFKKIGSRAFGGCDRITEVQLPEGLIEIGEGAFAACAELTRINIPSKLNEIEDNVFFKCIRLSSLDLPDALTKIGDRAFAYTALEELRLPGSLKSLGINTFDQCAELRMVTMCSAVYFHGYNVVGTENDRGLFTRSRSSPFYGCTGLEIISAPAEVASQLPPSAFEYCNTPLPALLAAATPDLQLWYYWSLSGHHRCSSAAKQVVFTIMVVRLRVDLKCRGWANSAEVPAGLLPMIPFELWERLLKLILRHELGMHEAGELYDRRQHGNSRSSTTNLRRRRRLLPLVIPSLPA